MTNEKFHSHENMKSAPERLYEEVKGKEPKISKSGALVGMFGGGGENVEKLAELSRSRAQAARFVYESSGLTKKERGTLAGMGFFDEKRDGVVPEGVVDQLVKEGKPELIAKLAALKCDPEVLALQMSVLESYDKEIAELADDPKLLGKYRERYDSEKQILDQVIERERYERDLRALENFEAKFKRTFKKSGAYFGSAEQKIFDDLSKEKQTILEKIKTPASPELMEAMGLRRLRNMQKNLEVFHFAETESRTELIRELLPDLLNGAPVLFQGETGSGKSELARYICRRYLRKEPLLISISEQIKESQIVGSRGMKAGETFFDYSEFVKAIQNGTPIILDEVNLMPHEFAGILNDFLQLRTGDTWTHPTTGEKIVVRAPIFTTANLKSDRYKRYDVDPATLRRLSGGAGAREIHYLDFGKKDADGSLVAPETNKILSAVMADRYGNIMMAETEEGTYDMFLRACRKIQEDFTMALISGDESGSAARSGTITLKELVITLADQIRIMQAWKLSQFSEPIDSIILREFFHKTK
ncbi:MAG: AAA family ATPase [Candidatus Paceibacterota bacterium]